MSAEQATLDSSAVASESDTREAQTNRAALDSSAVPSGSDTKEAQTNRVIVVSAGHPTAEELAAVVVVLRAVSGGGADDTPAPTSTWSAPALRLRTAYGQGPGGWRASVLPR